MGQYLFENPTGRWAPTSNRELLLEVCNAMDGCISNTCFDTGVEAKTTYYDLGTNPAEPIQPGRFEQLDHVIVARNWLSNITSIWSDRRRVLQSHHFIQIVELDVDIPKTERPHKTLQLDFTELKDKDIADKYSGAFVHHWGVAPLCSDLGSKAESVSTCMLEAAKEILPTIPVQRKRPWISTRTLHLIEERNQERTHGATTDTIKGLNNQIQ